MAGYLGSTPVPQATQHRESFTATEGQTSFATAGYTPQFLDVFLNGSHLSPADFVATNSSDVVLVVAASADDICDIVSYTPFEVADATFTGTTTTDVSLTTGVLTANGGAVFNEGSADVDFRIESNGNANALVVDGGTDTVMIGTTDTNFNAGADNLIVGTGSGDCGITIYTGSSVGHKGSIFFGDTAAGDAANSQKGQISYEQNNEIMTFLTNNTLALTLALNGSATMANGLTLTDGNLVVANSHGIDFTANTTDGSDTSELLDDYEEGTFTPALTDNSGRAGTAAIGIGRYVRVGGLVHVQGRVSINGLASMNGNVILTGMPFSTLNATNAHASLNFGQALNLNITAGVSLCGIFSLNSVAAEVQKMSSTAGSTALTHTELSADGSMIFSGTYRAN